MHPDEPHRAGRDEGPETPPPEALLIRGPRQADERWGIFTVIGGEDAGMVIAIPRGDAVSMGRSPDCTICFDNANLSRLHAHVMRVGGEYIFSDARSKNGSYINDARVQEAAVLRDGDRVQLGTSLRLRFALVDEAEEQALRRMYDERKAGRVSEAEPPASEGEPQGA